MDPSHPRKVLFVSNGHGEDSDAGYVIRALRELAPEVETAAIAVVGQGAEYRKLGVPILAPTQDLPSGGFTNNNRLHLLQDVLRGGLIGLTVRQIAALRRHAADFDVVVGVGDVVAQSFALLSGRPYVAFISSRSALYEGTLRLGPWFRRTLSAPRCLAVVTRDQLTVTDLRRQGFQNVHLAGIPSLDWIVPGAVDLALVPGRPMVAMLPGSRLPEAERNLTLMLRFLELGWPRFGEKVQFRAALVPRLRARLDDLAAASGWRHVDGWLRHPGGAALFCPQEAFNDIVLDCACVIGMAGLAVEQAVALGKPAIQIPGKGPQFSYAYAEAQNRQMGIAVQTIGTGPADDAALREAACTLERTLDDRDYMDAAGHEGIARLGSRGGAARIAAIIGLQLDSQRLWAA